MITRRRVFRILWIPLVILLAAVIWRSATSRARPPANVELQTDIAFAQVGGRDLKLDLTRPRTAAGKLPSMVFIHGGGWTAGKKEHMHPLMFGFSQNGILCVTVEYRLAPKDRFPAQIEDVKAAVRWLRANADRYNVDADRIAAFGISAGAHLAALLAMTTGLPEFEGAGENKSQSSAVCAAICLAGPYDLELGYRHSTQQRQAEGDAVRQLLPALLGGTPDQVPSAYRKASPMTYVSRTTAPMLIVHGAEDPLVPIEQAEAFTRKLEETGVPVKFLRLPDGTHDRFGRDQEKTFLAIMDFAKQQLKAAPAK